MIRHRVSEHNRADNSAKTVTLEIFIGFLKFSKNINLEWSMKYLCLVLDIKLDCKTIFNRKWVHTDTVCSISIYVSAVRWPEFGWDYNAAKLDKVPKVALTGTNRLWMFHFILPLLTMESACWTANSYRSVELQIKQLKETSTVYTIIRVSKKISV